MREKWGKRFFMVFIGIFFLLICMPISSYAGVPMTINYQGYLTDSSGNPVDGNRNMTFKIYDAASGGNIEWTEVHSSVTVSDGIFNIILGEGTALTTNILDGVRWLGVEIGSDGEMTPRQKLTSIAYAIRAKIAESAASGSIDSDALADNAVTAVKMADNSVGSGEIQNGSVSSGDLQDGATLAEISDNDGSGSGLDADFLDGQDGSFYRNASNINAGTLNNALFSAYSDLGAEGYLGNSSGDLAQNNGVLQTNLNADRLDGKHDSDFAAASHSHDHGLLSGRGDDDHPQYLLANGSRAMTGHLKTRGIEAVTAGGSVTASDGDIAAQIDLSCGDDLHVGRHIDVGGDADIGNKLTVNGYIRANGGIEAGTPGSSASAGEICSQGGMWCGGTLEAQTGLHVHNGDLNVWNGNFKVWSGTKNAVVETENYGMRLMHAMESTEVWFEDFGSGQLENGVTTIHLDPIFLETVTIDEDHTMKVFVSLTADCNGVYVLKGLHSFQVIELNGGMSNAAFDYKIIAKRKGYEDERSSEVVR